MSVSGVVLSVDVERYGDTLTAATTATDVVLQVEDVVDFADEDDFAAGPQWLVIGDSAPMQYVSVDDDADTVTLASPVGAVYEAGEPVRMWDASANAEVVGYLCWVELDEADEGDQPIPAEVRHERMTYFGVDNLAGLIGARVSLVPDEDDPEAWHVDQVIGRAPVLDAGSVLTPHIGLYRPNHLSVSTSTLTRVTGWFIHANPVGFPFVTSGRARIEKTGTYQVTATAMFLANGTGLRSVRIALYDFGGIEHEQRIIAVTPIASSRTAYQATATLRIPAGYWVQMDVLQSSGAALDLLGYTDGSGTALEITWVGP